MNYNAWARLLFGGGLMLIVLAGLFFVLGKLGATGFHIPGDIYIKKGNFSLFFPLASCILLSIILTIIINLVGRR